MWVGERGEWIWSGGNVNILLTTMNLGRSNEQFKIERCCGSFAYDVRLVVGYGKRKRKNYAFKLHISKIQIMYYGFCFLYNVRTANLLQIFALTLRKI